MRDIATELLEKVRNLDVPAFVGKPGALDELIAIAELTFENQPSVAAAAYKSISDARRHKIFILNTEIESLQSRIRQRDEYAKFIIANEEAIRASPRQQGCAPIFSDYLRMLAGEPIVEDRSFFLMQYVDQEYLDEELEKRGETKGREWYIALSQKVSYLWVCEQFESRPNDAESASAMEEGGAHADLSKQRDLLERAELWSLTERRVSEEGSS